MNDALPWKQDAAMNNRRVLAEALEPSRENLTIEGRFALIKRANACSTLGAAVKEAESFAGRWLCE